MGIFRLSDEKGPLWKGVSPERLEEASPVGVGDSGPDSMRQYQDLEAAADLGHKSQNRLDPAPREWGRGEEAGSGRVGAWLPNLFQAGMIDRQNQAILSVQPKD